MMKPRRIVAVFSSNRPVPGGPEYQLLYRMLVPAPNAKAACGGIVRTASSPKDAIDFL